MGRTFRKEDRQKHKKNYRKTQEKPNHKRAWIDAEDNPSRKDNRNA